MFPRASLAGSFLVLTLIAPLVVATPVRAKKLQWAKRLGSCEPPARFYSPNHQAGIVPCCPVVEGMCAGGVACPASGVCPGEGRACEPAPIAPRPNVVLFISDDQAYCAYGSAGECRSIQTGTPIPPPSSPNLDLLAGYGTVFPIAHNTASWCFPSLATIVTGRYQRSINGTRKIGEKFTTISKAMRSLGADSAAPPDPYNAGNVIGGYCTFLGGKFTSSTGDPGFDGLARGRKLGRTTCVAGAPGAPPRCGSEVAASYSPTTILSEEDMFSFLESLFLRVPDTNPAEYAMQHFFAWVAPRVPHQPLTAPSVIQDYLFGGKDLPALGGLLQLGRYCQGGACPPLVRAFTESNFGKEYDYYANVWWVDDAVREMREYLERASAPHCIGTNGLGRYDISSPAECPGTWASAVSPDLPRNTVLIYMSDNGWFLPNSKHVFSENGYRTRMIVFDPRTLPTVPGFDGTQQTLPPATVSRQLAHSSDVLPTALGYALDVPGSQPCPLSADGTRCDGQDLRPYVFPASTSGTPAAPLRHALCGHHTQRPTAPTRARYLLSRPGSIGRCTNLDAPACSSDAQCGAGATCLGGHCLQGAEAACSGASTPCGPGATCLGGRCRVAPACVDDATCSSLFPGGHTACVEPETFWCRNAPGVRCSTDADCPACPAGPGPTPPPCSRLCEARQLKLYVSAPTLELTDLFLDPDEHGLHAGIDGEGTIAYDLSRPGGPYQSTMSRLECCIDTWWPEGAVGSTCSGGCPTDFACNE